MTLQVVLLAIYRVVAATGVLNTFFGRALFERAYLFYKARYEAGPVDLLRQWVKPSTVIIDVGANVGFFTLQFASWAAEGGKVIAIEPEATNFARLEKAIVRAGFGAVVETVNAAAGDMIGEALLEINPLHPGDHKLGLKGTPVAMTTIDDLLSARGWPEVSLIKIDVQGAEARVLAGARETLNKVKGCRPALFIEVDDQGLRQYGSSAAELLAWCAARGYTIQKLIEKAVSVPLTVDEALDVMHARGYADFLLLPTTK
jgi:FkbM family methyltransferase